MVDHVACWYIYDHDELLNKIPGADKIRDSETWKSKPYHYPRLSESLKNLFKQYRIPVTGNPLMGELPTSE